MRRTLAASLSALIVLVAASTASAHYTAYMTADCYGAALVLKEFSPQDGPVAYTVTVDGKQTNAGTQPAFSGNKTISVKYPTALVGPASHTVVFSATWPRGKGSLSKTVSGCKVPPPQLPCPNQPPTAPCNCPPGPAGPAGEPGTTTVVTVVQNTTTVVYRDKSCTSQRVFHIKVAKRLPRDDVFGSAAGQRIVSARITWRGADATHKNVVKKATAKKLRGRLLVDADFRNVVAVPGQVRVIDLRVVTANGLVRHLTREVRLCMIRDGDLNAPTDVPQNGKSNGAQADAARAAKKSSARS